MNKSSLLFLIKLIWAYISRKNSQNNSVCNFNTSQHLTYLYSYLDYNSPMLFQHLCTITITPEMSKPFYLSQFFASFVLWIVFLRLTFLYDMPCKTAVIWYINYILSRIFHVFKQKSNTIYSIKILQKEDFCSRSSIHA